MERKPIKEVRWRRIVVSILQLLIRKIECINKKVKQKVRPASERIYLEDDTEPGLYNPDGKSIKFERF